MSSAVKHSPSNHDYIYDNNYIVSGDRDHEKAATNAKLSTVSIAVCPIFSNMFSDLPNYPRNHRVHRRLAAIPEFTDKRSNQGYKSILRRDVSVAGTDRHRFFTHVASSTDGVSNIKVTAFEPQLPAMVHEINVRRESETDSKNQTMLTENEAQTDPWQPDCRVMDQGDPELLKLDFLRWGAGLPAGVEQVDLIRRARMKRSWARELEYREFGPLRTPQERYALIEAMERDEWSFRENEIQKIQDLRLELLEKMLNEMLDIARWRTEMKLKHYCAAKDTEKTEKLRVVHKNANRERKRLEANYHGMIYRYKKPNVVDEFAQRSSEAYAPLLRHGNNPRYWHFDVKPGKYSAHFINVENFQRSQKKDLEKLANLKENSEVRLPGSRLCTRETKWTEPVLKMLYEDLREATRDQKWRLKHCTIRTRVERPPADPPTPRVEEIRPEVENVYQALLAMQSALRGRHSQILIYEGRKRCAHLIEELRSSHSIMEDDERLKGDNKLKIKGYQREEIVCQRNMSAILGDLKRLEGTVVGTLLDFLSKELVRLQEERRAHALCLLAERQRAGREAAEAGKRQLEMRRRCEHDQIFKQVMKVTQDNVDVYLEDIVAEGLDFISTEEAKLYVQDMAKEVDEANALEEQRLQEDVSYKEELVVGLWHNFLVPEVHRQLLRDKFKKQQDLGLRAIHEQIYSVLT